MNRLEFKEWRDRLGLTQEAAGKALGISTSTIENYERGSRRDNNDPVPIPAYVELACLGLSLRLAAQTMDVRKATPEARTLSRDLQYYLSLGTSISQGRVTKFYDTMHDGLRNLREIPVDEMSLLEMLFPMARASDLRKAMFSLGNKEAENGTEE